MRQINKYGSCPACSHSWDGGSIAEHLIEQKASGNLYLADKSDDLIREIVKDDFGSEDARYSRLVIATDNSEAKCPDCNHIFPKPVFVSNDLSYSFFNTKIRKEADGANHVNDIDAKNLGLSDYIRNLFGYNFYISRRRKNGPSRTIELSGNIQIRKIMEWLYKGANFYLKRKKESFDSFLLEYKNVKKNIKNA